MLSPAMLVAALLIASSVAAEMRINMFVIIASPSWHCNPTLSLHSCNAMLSAAMRFYKIKKIACKRGY